MPAWRHGKDISAFSTFQEEAEVVFQAFFNVRNAKLTIRDADPF
jgi:hypothetical protein